MPKKKTKGAAARPIANSDAVVDIAPRGPDLEIKEPKLIFNAVWKDLEAERGRENLRFPKELILLGGAPGAGKGTQTDFILQARGLGCPSIVVSSLLNSPEMRKIKDAGGLVGDREVVGTVFRELLKPGYKDGAVLDGFPRTKVQVECLKLLVDTMNELRREYHATRFSIHFRQPTIHIMVLFVSEAVSVERQLNRGREIAAHNARVRESGEGTVIEERATDTDETTARRRYKVFKDETWAALQSLREHFFYHFVEAEGSVQEVQRNILRELQYQSSLELDPQTFEALRGLPLATEITRHARVDLVRRLDSYELEHTKIFHRIIAIVQDEMMPVIRRHAIAGLAFINSEDAVFDSTRAVAMLIDIFSERGYHAVVDIHRNEIPERINLKTGKITSRVKRTYRFQIRFQGSQIRRE